MGLCKSIEQYTIALMKITKENPERIWVAIDVVNELNKTVKPKKGGRQHFKIGNVRQVGRFLGMQKKVEVNSIYKYGRKYTMKIKEEENGNV